MNVYVTLQQHDMHYPLGSRQIYSFVATTTKLMYGNIVHVLDNCHHLPSLNVIVARIIVMIQTVVIITMKSMKMVTTTKTSNWGFTKANNLQKIEEEEDWDTNSAASASYPKNLKKYENYWFEEINQKKRNKFLILIWKNGVTLSSIWSRFAPPLDVKVKSPAAHACKSSEIHRYMFLHNINKLGRLEIGKKMEE